MVNFSVLRKHPHRVLLLVACSLLFISSVSTEQVAATTNTFMDDFATTAYRDVVATTTSGWGDGSLTLGLKEPLLIGTCDNLTAYKVYVSGNFAYIADRSEGLRVVNITDTAHPEIVASFDTTSYTNDVFVEGNYAYIADSTNGLWVVNITDPTDLSERWNCATPYSSWGVIVEGNYAYVADRNSGLQVINVTNPASPTLLNGVNTPGSAQDVAITGNYAYVADFGSGLHVVDISSPGSPSSAGSCATTGYAVGIYVSGDYAYVAQGSAGFEIIDIADPTNPTVISTHDTGQYGEDVSVSGDYAYVADGIGGLVVFNVTDPSDSTELCAFNQGVGVSTGLHIEGSFAYIADGMAGLSIFRISDPITPVPRASYTPPGETNDVFVEGNYAYVADGSEGLRVVNITNPKSPDSVGAYDTAYDAQGVYVSGNYAYIADGDDGLQVVNITNPSNPTWVGAYDTPGDARGVAVSGDYAYIADNGRGLQVIDITDPANPVYAGDYWSTGSARRVTVSGDYAFVADLYNVRIFKISDPHNPDLVSSYPMGSNVIADVAVSGDYAFIAETGRGMRILNISDIRYPTHVSLYASIGATWGLTVVGDYVYATDLTTQALRIIDVSDLENPSSAGTCSLPGSPYYVSVAGDFAYVTTETAGLRVVEVLRTRCIQYNTPATAQSTTFYSVSTTSLVSATLTPSASEPADTSITYYLSANGGAIWESVTPGIEHIFTFYGYELKWRAVLETTDVFNTPSLSVIFITYHARYNAPTLTAPANETGTNDNTPRLQWSSIPSVPRYLLQLDTTPNFDSPSLMNFTVGLSEYTLSTPLDDGLWYWRVAVNDTDYELGYFSSIYRIFIDTAAPTWDQTPQDQIIEYDGNLIYDVDASDASDIDHYWVNDTVYFAVDGDGIVTNILPLSVEEYGLEVRAYDPYNYFCSETITINVQDTTDPTWNESLSDQILEFGSDFIYNVNASDLSVLSHYWVNDTTHFDVDGSGHITNIGQIPVGVYGLEVRAYDTYENYAQAYFNVNVEDTTAPTWITTPSDQYILSSDFLDYQLEVVDLSNISHWIVNGTDHFAISSSGRLASIGLLDPGQYGLSVQCFDIYDNYCEAIFRVIVTEDISTSATTTTSTSTATSTITTTSETSTTTTSATSPTTSISTTTSTTPTGPDDSLLVIVIVIGAGAVIIVFVIIIVFKKKQG
ncbi:MAG: hypothetical protein RTU30_13500 [Candidatus Thorarchaeota archaeon]